MFTWFADFEGASLGDFPTVPGGFPVALVSVLVREFLEAGTGEEERGCGGCLAAGFDEEDGGGGGCPAAGAEDMEGGCVAAGFAEELGCGGRSLEAPGN